MKAMVSKPYAKVLKEAFPQATFVGFTGTPIAETYQTFGDEIDRYTMIRLLQMDLLFLSNIIRVLQRYCLIIKK